MSLFPSHALLDDWFERAIGPATPIQCAAWPVLRQGRSALLIAGTGQGKTLAAWRPIAEALIDAANSGDGPCRSGVRGVQAIHVAPLKALARDILVNLDPLLAETGRLRGTAVSTGLRCGDCSAGERRRQLRSPPEVLSTTPESLFVLLASSGGRQILRSVRHVVIDEVHALATDRRGSHLALTLERLDALIGRPVQRIGLSATAEPADELAAWLGGARAAVTIAPDTAFDRSPRIHLERPGPPLGAFPGLAHWTAIHDRLAELADGDGGLLVFCTTRAQVERTAAALGERLGEARVGAHHGSLDSQCREDTESAFREGRLNVLVGSASLELGLDLGCVERVVQVGSPGGLNALRQRAGRSRHRPGQRSQLHWFPLTRHQLLEVEGMIGALAEGRMDRLETTQAHRDVLAQQVQAMVAFDGLATLDELLVPLRRSRPWRDLDRAALGALATALSTADHRLPTLQRAPVLAYDAARERLHVPSAMHRLLRANAGTIPEWFEYRVVDVGRNQDVGRLDEEFAFESSPGQVIQLGHRRYRILRIRCGQVDVEAAEAEPDAELPFWFGEGPGRSGVVRRAILERMAEGVGDPALRAWLDRSREVLGALPSPDRLVIERFKDPNGDRHLVLHSFAGARINRAWGLALRKRFCRQFNFELQAAATDDGVLISLGVTSEFEPEAVVRFVRSTTARDVLIQALLDTPLFLTRFRWAANTALLLPRIDLCGPVSAQQQRSRTENLIACVFPDQLACLENLSGPREVPDHPLVTQALEDCLNDHMDVEGLIELLDAIETGRIQVHAVDLDQPSPLAEGLIHAPRHSFLDEAAAEERRTRSFERVPGRRVATAGPSSTASSRAVPPRPGVERAKVAVAPPTTTRSTLALPRTAEALSRLLQSAGFLTAREGERGFGLAKEAAGGWSGPFATLVRARRAVALRRDIRQGGVAVWVSAERCHSVRRLWPELSPSTWLPPHFGTDGPELDERQLRARRRRLGLAWPDFGAGNDAAPSASFDPESLAEADPA
jgi:ATP-dependent Lhr-like helicase